MHPQTASLRPVLSGNVIQFAPARLNLDDRLTWRDRITLHQHRDQLEAAGYRYVAHPERSPDGAPYDLVQLFRGDESWSTWCLVRRGERLHAWRCADGADLALFTTMIEALAALMSAPAYARARRTALV